MSIIKQIAVQSGVSSATVGHILGNKQHMHSAATRERVMEHAVRLGYRPNSSAKAIGSGRFNCVTLLLSTVWHQSFLPDNMLIAIHDALDESDYHLNVSRMTDERMMHETSLPKFLREWMSDGILVNYTNHIPQKLIDGIAADRAPAIWINSKQESDCVYPDDFAAGLDATRHLIDLGHRSIAYMAAFMNHYSAHDRYQGYLAAMNAAGYEPRCIRLDGPAKEWAELAKEICESAGCPTAFVAYRSSLAVAIVYAAEHAGRRVPEDVSVVTFDGVPVADMATGKLLTTWIVPDFEVGRVATQALMAKIATPSQPRASISVPFTHTADFSCAPRG